MNIPDPSMNWMDRLSDAVGYYYPGGRYLRSRHPIKVTLLMGLLGLASGWLTMIAGVCVAQGFSEKPIFLTAGVLLGIVVAVPWAVWLGARVRFLLPLVAYVALGNAIGYAVIDQFKTERFALLGLFLYGALTAGCLAVPGMVLSRRFQPMWLVATMLTSGAVISSYWVIKDNPLLRKLPSEVALPLIIAWFFTLIHTPTAICLGYPLWDWTPLERPKLEPDIGENP